MAELTIEEKMAKLESLVRSLESDKLTLEESLAKYEEAMNLSKELTKELDAVTKKVLLIQDGIKTDFE